MATTLPIPPTNVPVFDDNGIMVEVWRRYFLSLENLGPEIPPVDAQYWVSTFSGTLTNERNLGALASGYLKITVGSGVAVPSTAATIPAGDLTPGGTLPALNGSALTALNASALASGSVPDARLSSNVPLKNGSNVFTSSNTFPAGAGAGTVVPSGRVASLTSAVATTGLIEEVLFSYTMPANTLNVNGQSVRISGGYSTAANANMKTLNVRVGGLAGTIIASFGSATNAGFAWFDALVTRRTATTGYGAGFGIDGVTNSPNVFGALTATFTAPVVIVVTGTTPTTIGDMTLQQAVVEYLG